MATVPPAIARAILWLCAAVATHALLHADAAAVELGLGGRILAMGACMTTCGMAGAYTARQRHVETLDMLDEILRQKGEILWQKGILLVEQGEFLREIDDLQQQIKQCKCGRAAPAPADARE